MIKKEKSYSCPENENSKVNSTEASPVIRFMEEKDVEQLVEMEQEIFSLPWSENDFRKLLELSYCRYFVATIENKVVGFAGMMELCGEGDIDKVMVAMKYRGKHIAEKLLQQVFLQGTLDKIESYTLEVRAGNVPAIRLYEKMGFVSEGVRPGFYDCPKEDALIMWRR